jgi:glycosyltransferase involved in cell wall biosynthesis
MRILCVTPWFPRHEGDKEGNFILHSLDALADAGHEISVLVTRAIGRGSIGDGHAAHGFPVTTVRHLSIPRNRFRPVSDFLYAARVEPALGSMARRFGPQVIHAHTEAAGVVAARVAARLQCASAVTLHGINTDPRLNAARQVEHYRRNLSRAGRIVIVGEPLRAHFGAMLGGDERFRVVPNGVRLSEAPAPKTLVDDGSPLELISVSDLVEGKGIDLNLEALAGLDKLGRTRWRYTVVGDGPDRSELQERAAMLGLGEKVRFVGRCRHDEVFAHLLRSDVFVLPSYREAFGIAYLEAMACGLLTIGVRGQGAEAFIRHGETGLLVAPKDAQALASCLRQVIDRFGEMGAMAARGAAEVREQFTWERHAERLAGVFGELVAP